MRSAPSVLPSSLVQCEQQGGEKWAQKQSQQQNLQDKKDHKNINYSSLHSSSTVVGLKLEEEKNYWSIGEDFQMNFGDGFKIEKRSGIEPRIIWQL